MSSGRGTAMVDAIAPDIAPAVPPRAESTRSLSSCVPLSRVAVVLDETVGIGDENRARREVDLSRLGDRPSDTEHRSSPAFQEGFSSGLVDQQRGRVAGGHVPDGVGGGVDDVHAERCDKLVVRQVEPLLCSVEGAVERVRLEGHERVDRATNLRHRARQLRCRDRRRRQPRLRFASARDG